MEAEELGPASPRGPGGQARTLSHEMRVGGTQWLYSEGSGAAVVCITSVKVRRVRVWGGAINAPFCLC